MLSAMLAGCRFVWQEVLQRIASCMGNGANGGIVYRVSQYNICGLTVLFWRQSMHAQVPLSPRPSEPEHDLVRDASNRGIEDRTFVIIVRIA